MTIIRTSKKENPFVQLDKYFIEDTSLSWKSKGILSYILSRPDGWQIRHADLVKRSKEGKNAVTAALKELKEAGYIYHYQERGEGGKFGDWVWEVYERPEFNPRYSVENGENVDNKGFSPNPQKRDAVLPDAVLPDAVFVDYSNNDFNNNDFNNIKEEEEEGASPEIELASYFSKNITPIGNGIIKNKFSEWLNILPFEVLKAELETCALHGAKSWKYVEKTFKEDLELNIQSLDDLNNKHARYENKRIEKKKKPSKGKAGAGRVEVLPSWFDEDENIVPAAGGAEESEESKRKQILERINGFKNKES